MPNWCENTMTVRGPADRVAQFVSDMKGLDDDGKERGIRERWAQVYAVGPDVDDISVGQWVLIKHGRWSRGIKVSVQGEDVTIRQAEYPDAILLVSQECPIES
jgi:hypothetical protein